MRLRHHLRAGLRRLRRATPAPALLVAALSPACDGGASPAGADVVRTDSAGVEVVTSPPGDRPLAWTLEPAFTAGGEAEGPASFTSVGIGNVGVDASGRVYVMDRNAHRVVVFDSTGAYVRSMGSGGGGPGELQFPIGLAVSPGGTAAVFDIGKGRLVFFGSGGEPGREVPFPHNTEPGVRRAYAITDEHVVVAKGFMGGNDARSLELRAWPRARAAPDTTRFTRLELPSPEMADFGCMRIAFQKIFAPLIQWDVEDGVVAAIDSDRYRVDLYALEGPLVRSLRRDIAPVPATRELALAEVARGLRMAGGAGSCEATAEEVVEERGFADRVPALADVALAPNGEIWVERFRPGTRASRESGPIDVFDRTGAYLGTLPPRTPFPLAFLSADLIAISQRDALDVERLIVLRVDRRPVGPQGSATR